MAHACIILNGKLHINWRTVDDPIKYYNNQYRFLFRKTVQLKSRRAETHVTDKKKHAWMAHKHTHADESLSQACQFDVIVI